MRAVSLCKNVLKIWSRLFSACFAKRGSQNLIFSLSVLPIKVDVENLVLRLETVIGNTLRPRSIGSLLMNTTKPVEAHF